MRENRYYDACVYPVAVWTATDGWSVLTVEAPPSGLLNGPALESVMLSKVAPDFRDGGIVRTDRRRSRQAGREPMARLMERLAGMFPELSRTDLERAVRGDYSSQPEYRRSRPAARRTA